MTNHAIPRSLTLPQRYTLGMMRHQPIPKRDIHPATLRSLLDAGYITETFFRMYAITDAGVAALEGES